MPRMSAPDPERSARLVDRYRGAWYRRRRHTPQGFTWLQALICLTVTASS